MINNLLRAATGIVTLPLDVAADFITLGGSLTDKPRPYTAEKAKDIMRNVKEATR